MQLSKRLQAVANLVTPGNRVADVGCDHAYTSIYLVENGISPRVIAMDINQGPIVRAKENIVKFGCEGRIDIRRSDGLKKLEAGEADTILIAGMGGGLTNQIISEQMEVVKSVQELILQPQSEIYKVRQLLTDNNFIITKENMVKEDGKYYFMMKAEPAEGIIDRQRYVLTEKEHFYYGRLLLEQQNPILAEFLAWDMEICEEIMKLLTDGQAENVSQRQMEIRERMDLIRCGMKYYQT